MKACEIVVKGLVQGIGYRPFVAELAEELGLSGQVKNDGGIVIIKISGEEKAVDDFIHRLNLSSPEGSKIDEIQVRELPMRESAVDEKLLETVKSGRFQIAESSDGEEDLRLLPPDLPTCKRCERELLDPANRRYRYPFISCVSCGPRFSIMKRVPYDRDSITMDQFPMCDACQKEYTEKGNVRRHAQTIACPHCGPVLTCDIGSSGKSYTGEEALQEALKEILSGKIAAVKDIGGYHFAFLPTVSEPAARLRSFKNREAKPFAIMFPDMDGIREYCEVSDKERELLESGSRPIVLLKKKKDFCREVCGESDRMGAMLPCNPLQILLLKETGPLVMTSGNRGGEPIIIREEDMRELMAEGCPDLMLTHDREILTPLDDSIFQVTEWAEDSKEIGNNRNNGSQVVQIIRRARGIVPEPVAMNRSLPEESFAAGGDLKAVFGLGKKNRIYLSGHFGDLTDYKAKKARECSMAHMEKLLNIYPKAQGADLHPLYQSAQGIDRRFQHHHAHVASVIAEYGLTGKTLGIAFDGTGYGTDGTVWGSEFLVCEKNHFKRLGHLRTVKMTGGDAGAKNADASLAAFLWKAEQEGYLKDWSVNGLDESRKRLLTAALAQEINVAGSSSMGRLFDAVASLLDVKHENSYEGECAVAVEGLANRGTECYPIHFKIDDKDGCWQADSVQLIAELFLAKNAGVPVENLAAGFHQAVAEMTVEIAGRICEEEKIQNIALCGGTFYNRILLQQIKMRLEQSGKNVYVNEKVPSGDGGLALGQMYLMTWQED